jgi:general stress protein YciG
MTDDERRAKRIEDGRKGGLLVAARYGTEHLRAAGQKGGEATVLRHGADHFSELGKRGAARKRALLELGRQAEGEQNG